MSPHLAEQVLAGNVVPLGRGQVERAPLVVVAHVQRHLAHTAVKRVSGGARERCITPARLSRRNALTLPEAAARHNSAPMFACGPREQVRQPAWAACLDFAFARDQQVHNHVVASQ
jgi:hypothetical protein